MVCNLENHVEKLKRRLLAYMSNMSSGILYELANLIGSFANLSCKVASFELVSLGSVDDSKSCTSVIEPVGTVDVKFLAGMLVAGI
jgi:hypothetical protein